MSFSQAVQIGVAIFGGILFVSYIVGFIRVILFERKINSLHEQRDKEVETLEASKPPLDQSGRQQVDMRISLVIEGYSKQIETVERKRRFLLDKLPFIKR
jgi:hypothetical protein